MAQHAELVREAEEYLLEAASSYEAQRPGLAHRFLSVVERVIGYAVERPLAGAPLGGRIRRYLVPGFRYAII